MPINIATTGSKGGIGKSTSSTNIARSFADNGVRTCVIDMDTQGNATKLLLGNVWDENERPCINGVPWKGVSCLLDNESEPVEDAIQKTSIENLWLIGQEISDEKGRDYNLELMLSSDPAEGLYKLQDIIKDDYMVKNFDVCIIDTPPNKSIVTLSSIIAADFVILPTTQDELDYESMSSFVKFVNKAAKRGDGVEILGSYITICDKSKPTNLKLAYQALANLQSEFGIEAFNTVIPTNSILGRTKTFESCRMKKAKNVNLSYDDLTTEIYERIKLRLKARSKGSKHTPEARA